MKFGVHGLNRGSCSFPETALRVAQTAEAGGFESLWVADHLVMPDPRPEWYHLEPTFRMLDPLVSLAFLSAHTRTIRLGTGVVILPQRHPVVIAKQLASLDVLSGGRLIVGVGVGYVEAEFQAVGVPFEERGPRTDEYLGAIRTLWAAPQPLFAGQFVAFSEIQAHPQPLQQPHPPIVIGGSSAAAYRRAVQQGHGWYGFGLDLAETAQAVADLRTAAQRYARPAELGALEISVNLRVPLDAALVEQLALLGVARVILALPAQGSPADLEQFVRCAGQQLIGSAR